MGYAVQIGLADSLPSRWPQAVLLEALLQSIDKEVIIVKDILLGVDQVMKIVGHKEIYAYKLIQRLNAELKSKGYITIRGKISQKYIMERMYLKKGMPLLNYEQAMEITGQKEVTTRKTIQRLNAELKSKGYIIVKGRIPKKYLIEAYAG